MKTLLHSVCYSKFSPEKQVTIKHKVRFWDPFGNLLKEEYVNHGGNATPPTNVSIPFPFNKFLTFDNPMWIGRYTNVQHPSEVILHLKTDKDLFKNYLQEQGYYQTNTIKHILAVIFFDSPYVTRKIGDYIISDEILTIIVDLDIIAIGDPDRRMDFFVFLMHQNDLKLWTHGYVDRTSYGLEYNNNFPNADNYWQISHSSYTQGDFLFDYINLEVNPSYTNYDDFYEHHPKGMIVITCNATQSRENDNATYHYLRILSGTPSGIIFGSACGHYMNIYESAEDCFNNARIFIACSRKLGQHEEIPANERFFVGDIRDPDIYMYRNKQYTFDWIKIFPIYFWNPKYHPNQVVIAANFQFLLPATIFAPNYYERGDINNIAITYPVIIDRPGYLEYFENNLTPPEGEEIAYTSSLAVWDANLKSMKVIMPTNYPDSIEYVYEMYARNIFYSFVFDNLIVIKGENKIVNIGKENDPTDTIHLSPTDVIGLGVGYWIMEGDYPIADYVVLHTSNVMEISSDYTGVLGTFLINCQTPPPPDIWTYWYFVPDEEYQDTLNAWREYDRNNRWSNYSFYLKPLSEWKHWCLGVWNPNYTRGQLVNSSGAS